MPQNAHNGPAAGTASSTKPDWRKKRLLLAGSLLVTLLIVEVGLRIAGYGAHRGPRFQEFAGRDVRLLCYNENLNDYLDLDLMDAAVRKEIRDKYDIAEVLDTTYYYTPHGVITPYDKNRMRPGQFRPKPMGKIRLIAIGDSFTYCHGLKAGHPWPAQLEKLLNAGGGDRFEVLNCGVSGADLPWIANLFQKRLLALRPDAVIYGWYLNDPVRSAELIETHRKLTEEESSDTIHLADRYMSLGWKRVSGPRRWSAIYDLASDKLGGLGAGNDNERWLRDMYGPANAKGWAKSQELLARMAEACRAKGVAMHLAIWPMLFAELGSDYPLVHAHEATAEACRKAGIVSVDLRESLKAHPIESLILLRRDGHPSRLACRVAAEALRDHLRQHHADWFR